MLPFTFVTTLLPLLILTNPINATAEPEYNKAGDGDLGLHSKGHGSCNLKIENFFGCTKTVLVDKHHTCDKLDYNKVYSGSVCGIGSWLVSTQDSKFKTRWYDGVGSKVSCTVRNGKSCSASLKSTKNHSIPTKMQLPNLPSILFSLLLFSSLTTAEAAKKKGSQHSVHKDVFTLKNKEHGGCAMQNPQYLRV
ncbi:MAG: hypothetical protein Q9166_006998 [cf. Caloplaca sp. 2 TL-2023]